MTTSPTPLSTPYSVDLPLTSGEAKGAWTYATLDGSSEVLGTRRAVKVRTTIDGHETDLTLLPMGDGTHMFPIKAKLRDLLGKSAGDTIAITITHTL